MICFELDSSPREDARRSGRRGAAHEPGGVGGKPQACGRCRRAAAARITRRATGSAPVLRHQLQDCRAIPEGRVFLVGDASHVHSPMGGPGLNLGLQDAVNLGWKLAAVLNGRVAPSLLDTYESERRPAAERVIMHSRAQLALVRPGPEITALRELFSELVTDPSIVRRLSDLVSGAEQPLRHRPTTHEHPLVGRWVPTSPCATAGATHASRNWPATAGHCSSTSPKAGSWRPLSPRSEPARRRRGTAGRRDRRDGRAGAPRRLCGMGIVGGHARCGANCASCAAYSRSWFGV